MTKLVIGISGASGIMYGVRLLSILKDLEVETHLVVTKSALVTLEAETDLSLQELEKLAHYCYDDQDLSAAIASGSFKVDGMIVAPCSIKTMSAIANSYNDNLLIRAADVTLKERRRLVLMVRETPLHLGHLKCMVQLTEMGAIIAPPVPSLYTNPKTIDELITQTVTRSLDLFGINNNVVKRWRGLYSQSLNLPK